MSPFGVAKPQPIKLGVPELSDVVLVLDQQEFHVHKTLLAKRSPIFQSMFFGQFVEPHADRIELVGLPLDGFRRFLELLYTSSVSDSDKFVAYMKDMTETRNDNGCTIYREVIGHSWESTEQQQQYIVAFWKCVPELLATADRFKLKKMVVDYLQQATAMDVCGREDCPICLNFWIFAEENKLNVRQTYRSFVQKTMKSWLDAIKTAPHCRGAMDFGLIEKFFEQIRKK